MNIGIMICLIVVLLDLVFYLFIVWYILANLERDISKITDEYYEKVREMEDK